MNVAARITPRFLQPIRQPKKMKTIASSIILAAALVGIPCHAATTLVSSDFEGSLGAWTASTGASLYTYGGSGNNFASSGDGAANLPKSGGTITLTNALPLASQAYTSVTISFQYEWLNGTTTRFLEILYAADGATFTSLARVSSGNGGTGGTPGSLSITLTENLDHTISGSGTILNTSFMPAFLDTAKFRFTDNASAGADVRVYVDNVLITGSPDFIVPEPSTALLGGLGMLCLLRRRR